MIALVVIVSLIQIYILPRFDEGLATVLLLAFAVSKAIAIIALSFNQLTKIIGQSHLLSHVLTLFAFLIGVIIVSFSIDFLALQILDEVSFKLNNVASNLKLEIGLEMFYFSIVTFSSVGYGDVVPTTAWAKALVILEIILRFFVLVFGIANINQIRINKNV